MIDLNSLALYKNKISSYLDENVLDISTKSNILNMFKIKNYTGNGIEPHGSVKIDENDKVLYNNINTFKYRPKDTLNGTKYICFGNISNTFGQPTNISYDLSECYIKIDDELVSTWNM